VDLSHLERLGLVCPTCRASGREAPALVLGHVEKRDGDDVIEGALLCPAKPCQREHPIIDGVVVAVADIGSWIGHQLDGLTRRDDLSAWMESLLGDASGRTTSFDRERHDLSTYATAHWGDRAGLAETGTLPALVDQVLAMLPEPPRGTWVDLGCALGRASHQLAAAGAELVVGVDLNFSMLRRAEQARRTGTMVWPQRRVGLVYDRRSAPLDGLPRDRVAYVCADVCVLPFAEGCFAGGLSLNVLDCVPSPLGHLVELGRVLPPGAPALLATPYDWAVSATAVEGWLGGHSQRGELGGDSETIMRLVLAPEPSGGVDTGLVIVEERDRVPWRLALTSRSTMLYEVHVLRLARRAA